MGECVDGQVDGTDDRITTLIRNKGLDKFKMDRWMDQ